MGTDRENESDSHIRPFQFRIKHLLAATLCVALLTAITQSYWLVGVVLIIDSTCGLLVYDLIRRRETAAAMAVGILLLPLLGFTVVVLWMTWLMLPN
jgi:hypothetical protein